MDSAIAALDFNKAGAIIASMVESYLAGVVSETRDQPSAPPPVVPQARFQHDAKGTCNDDSQDHREAPVTNGLRLHPPIDGGASPVQPGEHGETVQSVGQGADIGVETGSNPDSRSRSRSIGVADDEPRGLQSTGQRCRVGDAPPARWAMSARSSRSKRRDWHARTRTGIACSNCAP